MNRSTSGTLRYSPAPPPPSVVHRPANPLRLAAHRGVLLGCVLLAACSGGSVDWEPVAGSWEGAFMPESGMNLTLVLHVEVLSDGAPRARVLMWQDAVKIQDDPLTDLRFDGSALSFVISAKETPFEGHLSDDATRIRGRFLFPDGTSHAVDLRRVEQPSPDAPPPVDPAVLTQTYGPEALREDLRALREALERNHPALYRYADRTAWESAWEQTVEGLAEPLTEEAFLRRIAPLVAAIRCAHTGLRPSDAYMRAMEAYGRVFPLVVRVLDGRPVVVHGVGEEASRVLPGSELLVVNGTPASDVLDLLTTRLPADGFNESYRVFQVNRDFSGLYALYVERTDTYALALRDPSGRRYRVTLGGAPLPAVSAAYAQAAAHAPASTGGVPVALSLDEAGKTGVLTVGAFWAERPDAFQDVLADAFGRLRRAGVRRLVLDLRGNSGGYPALAADLLAYLADTSFVYLSRTDDQPVDFPTLYLPQAPRPGHFDGTVSVLVDGGCISSCGHVVAQLRYHGWATLVGETTGGSSTCNDASTEVVLPHTGLRLHVPRRTFRAATPGLDDADGLSPDHPMRPTVPELLSGEDAVLAYAFQVVGATEE